MHGGLSILAEANDWESYLQKLGQVPLPERGSGKLSGPREPAPFLCLDASAYGISDTSAPGMFTPIPAKHTKHLSLGNVLSIRNPSDSLESRADKETDWGLF